MLIVCFNIRRSNNLKKVLVHLNLTVRISEMHYTHIQYNVGHCDCMLLFDILVIQHWYDTLRLNNIIKKLNANETIIFGLCYCVT